MTYFALGNIHISTTKQKSLFLKHIFDIKEIFYFIFFAQSLY